MKKFWSVICVLFGMFFIAGCGFQPITGQVVEKEHDAGGYQWDKKKSQYVYEEECFELDIIVDGGSEEEVCVSERVWEDAMEGHQITLTEEYH
ncbi:hypothetical protein SEA_MAKAI_67 [Arthrobacter phage Makai]|nr:hypothetical protein SEA_MAKAI_67 [Arthrobacter phage Makai]